MQRQNQWFVPGTGIAREVITADIQRYLGNDALVRPGVGSGEYANQQGYWITAYRTLTSPMIEDLKLDSLRWQHERPPGASGREYQDSQTHRSRQHYGPTHPYGPTTTYDPYQQSGYEDPRRGSAAPRPTHGSAAGYSGTEYNYVTTPTQQHQVRAYGTTPASAAPRTQAVDPYAAYQQQQQQQTQQTQQQQQPVQQQQPPAARDARDYQQGYAAYPTGTTVDVYGRPTPAPGSAYAAPSAAESGEFYTASDGRRYLRSQMPAVAPAQNPQGRRGER